MGDVRDLFISRTMIHRTLLSWYIWFVCGLVYYGIMFSSPSIGGNMYLNFFIAALFEAVGMLIGIYLFNWFGRKKSIVGSLWVAGVAAIIAAVLSQYDDESDGYLAGKILTSMVVGKLFITIAFDGVFIYASELFPTVIRNTAMGSSSAAARVGSACAPYIVYSQRVHPLMPFGIMAINALISGILCMTLPETKDKAMPDTIKQVYMNSQHSGIDAGNTDDETTKLAPSYIMLESTA
ncbi:solute carrier family 22 member 15-like [Actinia tenebrosa]|uniref:Solute carrier family 22 member 15-like n=1 Tax=Actinia tenebrosa TaxID=6105 RepID=A0A6P8I740_ACTTE|nr:solute carrier family 22 member 15-like [Actinia tenebrosa]